MMIQRQFWPQGLSSQVQAILLMVLATVFTSTCMIFNKALVVEYSSAQIVFWRSVLSFLPLLFLLQRQGGFSTLKTNQWPFLIARGALGFLSIYAYCWSLGSVSLFTAQSLLYLCPIFVFVMGGFLLRENMPRYSLVALTLSVIGVVFIFQPGSDVASLGGGLAILSAFFYASEIILTRYTGRKDTPVTLFAYYTLVCFLGSCGVMSFESFSWPTTFHFFMFIALAFLNLGVNICFTEALRRAPASHLAPLDYLTIVWVTICQLVIWGEWPESTTFIGATFILVGGVWIVRNGFMSSFAFKRKQNQIPEPSIS